VISRPTRNKARPTSRQFWLVKCRESKERSKFFCCGKCKKTRKLQSRAPCGRNYNEFFHLLVRIHQIRMF